MGIHPLITAPSKAARSMCWPAVPATSRFFASDMIAGRHRRVSPTTSGTCWNAARSPGDPGPPRTRWWPNCATANRDFGGSANLIAAARPTRSAASPALRREPSAAAVLSFEGILVMEKTEFFARRPARDGIRNSQFVRSSGSLAMEHKAGRVALPGARKVSVDPLDPADLPKVPGDVLVYGRNGVQMRALSRATNANSASSSRRRARPQRARVAWQPAHPLPDPLRLSGTQGDRRQHCLSAVAEPGELQAGVMGSFGAIVPSGTRYPVSSRTTRASRRP